jgi:hypothetical protein
MTPGARKVQTRKESSGTEDEEERNRDEGSDIEDRVGDWPRLVS